MSDADGGVVYREPQPEGGDGEPAVYDPGTGGEAFTPGSEPEPGRKRRRRSDAGVSRGGGASKGTGKGSSKSSVDLSSLTGMFVGLHAMVAMKLDTPELMIEEAEGKQFMASAQKVLSHYSVETTQKTLDWIAFVGCTIGIYGPRMVAISVRRREQGGGRGARRAPPAVRQEGNVLSPEAWTIQPDLGFPGETHEP